MGMSSGMRSEDPNLNLQVVVPQSKQIMIRPAYSDVY
jgi:hypothetical protein